MQYLLTTSSFQVFGLSKAEENGKKNIQACYLGKQEWRFICVDMVGIIYKQVFFDTENRVVKDLL